MPLPLQTERLVIRPYRDDDATALHEVFGSPEVMRWTPSAPSKDVAETKQRLARTKIFALAESLGGVESLIEIPLAMTHGSVRGTKLAPPAGLVRLSVGIETVDDLMADLGQAIG